MLNDLALVADGRDSNPHLIAFLRDAQERGVVRAEELEALQHELDLDDETVEALRAALVEAEIEIEEPRRGAASSTSSRRRPPSAPPTACSSS